MVHLNDVLTNVYNKQKQDQQPIHNKTGGIQQLSTFMANTSTSIRDERNNPTRKSVNVIIPLLGTKGLHIRENETSKIENTKAKNRKISKQNIEAEEKKLNDMYKELINNIEDNLIVSFKNALSDGKTTKELNAIINNEVDKIFAANKKLQKKDQKAESELQDNINNKIQSILTQHIKQKNLKTPDNSKQPKKGKIDEPVAEPISKRRIDKTKGTKDDIIKLTNDYGKKIEKTVATGDRKEHDIQYDELFNKAAEINNNELTVSQTYDLIIEHLQPYIESGRKEYNKNFDKIQEQILKNEEAKEKEKAEKKAKKRLKKEEAEEKEKAEKKAKKTLKRSNYYYYSINILCLVDITS